PSLSEVFALAWDFVSGIDAPFTEIDPDQFNGNTPSLQIASEGGNLDAVATRLRLPLPSLIAALSNSGLPFPDDRIDAGVEQSLRKLLHLDSPAAALPALVQEPEGGLRAADSSPAAVAGRILLKLMRGH